MKCNKPEKESSVVILHFLGFSPVPKSLNKIIKGKIFLFFRFLGTLSNSEIRHKFKDEIKMIKLI